MKNMRKSAFLCATCLSITFCPISVSAAAADDVAAQIAAASGDKYSVGTKSLGYFALNKECPQEPEWYKNISLQESISWEQRWESYLSMTESVDKTYSVSITSDGDAIVQDGSTGSYGDVVKITKYDKNGTVQLDTAFTGLDFRRGNWGINGNMLSIADGLYISSDYAMNYYYDMRSGDVFKYLAGNCFYNGYTSVLEAEEGVSIWDVPQLSYDWEHGTSEPMGSLRCRFSVVNDKNEKIFTALEPIELITKYQGGAATEYGGANYTLDAGGYSDGLMWFVCDRQLGNTLNELLANTAPEIEDKYQIAGHKCGYTDLEGKIIIPQLYDKVYAFQDGIALVGINEEPENQWSTDWKFGFIDKSGNYVIEPKFEDASPFYNDLARVKMDGKWGYIDKTGKIIIEPQYEQWYNERNGKDIIGAGNFSNDVALVAVKDGDGPAKWGYINTKGETILPLEYDDAYGSDGTYFTVGKKIDDTIKYGVVDAEGKTVLPFIFEDVTVPVNGLVYAFYNRELYCFEISKRDPNNKKTEDIYELHYTPNGEKNYLTAKFDKSNNSYNLDLLAEKWYSHVYLPELASVLAVVASGAYSEDNTKFNLEQLGFNDYKTINYFDTKDEEYKRDSVAFSIAQKKLSNGDTLVLIPMRGSFGGLETLLYDQSDWRSNLRIDKIGDEIANCGFDEAARYVMRNIRTELGGKIPASGVKYIITGHSRAAGVGNFLAKFMIDSGVPQENIFDYNFACPDVSKDNESNWNPNNKYASIFNLCVPGDWVSVIPGAIGNVIYNPSGSKEKQWGKYGNSYWFAEDWNNIPNSNTPLTVIKAHDHGNYVNVFLKKMNVWEAKSYSDLRWQQWYNKISKLNILNYSSPLPKSLPQPQNIGALSDTGNSSNQRLSSIDIDILDQAGTLIASIRNDEITQQLDDDLLIMIIHDEDDYTITVYGRNDIHYRLIGTNSNEQKMSCMISTYTESNLYTDCYSYYEGISLPENSIIEMSIAAELDKQSEKMIVMDANGKVTSTIPSTMFVNAALYGDINLDKTVSVEDAQLTLNSYVASMAGLENDLTSQQIQVADISGDQEVSVDDAQLILLYYVKNTVAGMPTAWDELVEKTPIT